MGGKKNLYDYTHKLSRQVPLLTDKDACSEESQPKEATKC